MNRPEDISLHARGPLYKEVKRRLTESIGAGVWKPGTAIPTEPRLAEHYGVSIGTLRKAIDDLVADNPGLIMVHVSGYGRTGPRSAEAGFGSIGEGMGGIRHTTGPADGPSTRTGISLGDSLAGLFAVIGALAALAERSQSGRGQEVDVALYEAVAALMESTLADAEVAGVVRVWGVEAGLWPIWPLPW